MRGREVPAADEDPTIAPIGDARCVAQAPEAPAEPAVAPGPDRRAGLLRWRRPLLLIGPIVLLIGAIAFYLHGGRYETTDNALVRAGLVSVSPDIAGRVVSVEVTNNQIVAKGDVLFRIDPASYEAAVAEAEAQLATARAEVSALRANYAEGASELAAARERLTFADREAARQKQLLGEGISSQAQYDQARLAASNARQAIQTANEQNAGVAASLSGKVDAPAATQPAVQRAQAALDRARLNLGYTVVRAAQPGIVARVDQLQVGNFVTAGRPVFSLAANSIWIEANFKESQLRHMRLGQAATVSIDAFPDVALTARVSSFSPATGVSFSVLPAENATGNWVKVVQRLPVELRIDRVPADLPLRAGLSAEVSVDTGHRRRLFGASSAPVGAAASR